ncbi:hypothetical protein [Actinopolymorpha alba]|uniref:hypothetical protein n=1 Tax=Actinopolymorpha alba TaxID=533267 RepID=UPI000372CFC6|nr:hypothetical protein [Actinopolymorpha alba]
MARRSRPLPLFADKGWPRDTGEQTHLFFGVNYRMTKLQAAVNRAVTVRQRCNPDRSRVALGRYADAGPSPESAELIFWRNASALFGLSVEGSGYTHSREVSA